MDNIVKPRSTKFLSAADAAALVAGKPVPASAPKPAPADRQVSDGLQRKFLEGLLGKDALITLCSGRTLTGNLRAFDTFSVVVSVDGGEVLFYKHNLSSIAGTESK